MNSNNKLSIHINIKINAKALQSIVSHTKQMAQKRTDGVYHVDTADQVSAMVTRFLDEKDFDQYVLDRDNYPIVNS